MGDVTSAPTLGRQIADLRARQGDSVRVDDVMELVDALLDAMQRGRARTMRRVQADVGDVARLLREALNDVAALRPDAVTQEHLPAANEELDAVVKATADATHTIMDAAEALEAMQSELAPPLAERVADETTRIFEACAFQDITGQRVGKVVHVLGEVDARVTALVAAFGGANERDEKSAGTPSIGGGDGQSTDDDLLNGPQLPGAAKSQAEIDALLADLG